jgi:hypothetical protein
MICGCQLKIFRQLLKEFCIPFILSALWTAYATRGVPFDLAKVVSTFGPTFFLISWVVGQVFRVRKQVGVDTNFASVEARLALLASSLEKNVTTLIGNLNGGDSFCYLMPNAIRGLAAEDFVLRHCGDFPLYKLSFRIVDIGSLPSGKMREIGFSYDELPANSFNLIETSLLSGSRALNVFYHSRGGNFLQQIRFAEIDGQTCYAYNIVRDGVMLVQYLPDGFPLEGDDESSWSVDRGLTGSYAECTMEFSIRSMLEARSGSGSAQQNAFVVPTAD